MDQALLTSTALARALPLAVSPSDLSALARRGVLPAIKIGRQWRFTRRDVARIAQVLARHVPGQKWGEGR